jgi:hypothetical protein
MKLRKSIITEIQNIIDQSRAKAVRAVDNTRVVMYWQIGRIIFEEEQQGEDRAAYGTFLIQSLSEEFAPGSEQVFQSGTYTSTCSFTGFFQM